jgi:hypothetical protein
MTRTKAVLAAAVFAAFASAAQAQESPKQAKETAQLCADMAQTNAAINNFQNLSRDSTVAEAKAAEKRVSDSIDTLGKSARKVRPDQYKELKSAHEQLKDSMKDVPKDATLGQVQANIQASRERLRNAYTDLEQSVSCP